MNAPSSRIDAVDALRGFAVMLILLVHSIEHFIYPVYPDPTTVPDWLRVLDEGTFSVVFSLAAGKAYAIFALLFGLTYYIQYSRRVRDGGDFALRFLWRLLLLVGFATINAAFFPGGDVLLLFASLGAVLVITRRWSNKAVLVLAIILLLQPIEWWHYARHLANPGYSIAPQSCIPLYEQVKTAVDSGNWLTMFWVNVTTGQAASFLWALDNGRTTQTAGLFLLGCLLGRRGLFATSPDSTMFWTAVLMISAVIYAPLYELKEQLLVLQQSDLIKQTAGVATDMWQKLAFTGVLVSCFMLLYGQWERFRKLTAPLRDYGRMSLTNYVSQSIAGALIYFPAGLYLAPYCGYTVSLLVGVAILIVQITLCRWWFRRFKQGPLESLWHKLTWFGRSTPAAK